MPRKERRLSIPRRVIGIVALPAAALAAAFWIGRGRDAQPNAPATFTFAAFGDAPYNWREDRLYRSVLHDLGDPALAFVVHVGDLFASTCTRERYRRSLDEFNTVPHPLVYTPGDNEWTDCWQQDRAAKPLDQLAAIRETFFAQPSTSLGGRRIALSHQGEQGRFREFVENARWSHEGVVFATVHLVGSRNGLGRYPDRTEANDAEARRRTAAAAAWVRAAFAAARSERARAVVIAFHANPAFEDDVDDAYRVAYEPWLEALETEAARFAGPVLTLHGDSHDYTVDRPLRSRATGRRLDNVTRLVVPGSPSVGWVRVTVSMDDGAPFAFEPHVVPWWKLW